MWSHLYACHRNAVWLINQDVEPTLLAFRESAASAVRASSRCAVIDAICYAYGDRLLISVKACRTVDDADDIILVDLTQYLGVTRGREHSHGRIDASVLRRWRARIQVRVQCRGMPWSAKAVMPQHDNVKRS